MIPFQHWNCESCKRYNDVLNHYCIFCRTDKPSFITALHQMRIEFGRGIFDDYGVLASYHREGRVKLLTTPNEELHAKFFNEEAALVINMNDADLEEHIQELESIAREAKARILAGSQEKRVRSAKSGNKAWRVEPLGPDPTVTDSLNKVKQRSARMGKLDKMRAQMASLGIPDSELDQMMSKMIAQARKDPEALKQEAALKDTLKGKQEPTIITEEHKQEADANRKVLDDKDKAEEKERLKKEKEAAAVHNDKDEKLILVIEPAERSEAEVQAKKEAARLATLNLFGPKIVK